MSKHRLWCAVFALLASFAAAAFAASCATIDPLESGVCGNGVIDAPDEDCDSRVGSDVMVPSGTAVCGSTGEAACHYQCGATVGDGGTSVCPSGFGCDLGTGICNKPVNGFVQLGAPIVVPATRLRVGDFNGDGRADVLTLDVSDSQVFVGQSTGLARTYDLPFHLNDATTGKMKGTPGLLSSREPFSAAVGDLSDDVAISVPHGTAIFGGNQDGTLTPFAYPTIIVDSEFTFVTLINGPQDPAVAGKLQSYPYVFFPFSKKSGFTGPVGCGDGDLVLVRVGERPYPIHCFDFGLGDLGPILVADFVKNPRAICSEFAFTSNTDGVVYFFAPCGKDPTAPLGDKLSVWAEGSTTIELVKKDGRVEKHPQFAWGPFGYDVDGDGNLDIVVASSTGVFVGYGDGKGGFHSASGGEGQAGEYDVTLVPWASSSGPPPSGMGNVLALDDIDGDGRPDAVTTNGIYMSVPASLDTGGSGGGGAGGGGAGGGGAGGGLPTTEALYLAYAPPANAPGVKAAVITDVNGDGRNDVVAILSGQSAADEQIFILLSAPPVSGVAAFNTYALPLVGHATAIVSGDFNGDGLGDVAFIQQPDLQQPDADVYVIYGDHDANFVPVNMGNFYGANSILSRNLIDPNSNVVDGFTDLGVIANPSKGENTVAVLSGTSGRVMVAPLGLAQAGVGTNSRIGGDAVAATPGVFESEWSKAGESGMAFLAYQADLSGVKISSSMQFWTIAFTSSGGVDFTQSPTRNPSSPTTDITDGIETGGLLGQNNGPKFAITTARGAGGAVDVAWGAISGSVSAGMVASRVFSNVAPKPVHTFSFKAVSSGPELANPNLPPPTILAGEIDKTSGSDVVLLDSGGNLILWNQAATSDAPGAPIATNVADICLMPRVGEDGQFDVVYLQRGTGSVTVVKISRDDDFKPTTLPISAAAAGGGSPIWTAIAAGDFDGDRLPDVALTDGSELYLFHAAQVEQSSFTATAVVQPAQATDLMSPVDTSGAPAP